MVHILKLEIIMQKVVNKLYDELLYTISIANRHAIRHSVKFIIRQNNGKQLVGVEIGVNRGANSKIMLKNLNIKKLYLVDPYRVYEGIDGVVQKGHKVAWEEAHKNLKRFKDKIVWMRLLSEEAAKLLPDGLDFVYIDGNHKYDFVKKDIEVYWNKLKKGGVLAGHDFQEAGVAHAVTEFASKHNLAVGVGGYFRDWWILKEA
jgi:hypothetical protein